MLRSYLKGIEKHGLLLMLLLIVLPWACVKDNFDFDRLSDRLDYSPSFVIPLANGSLSLGNLLKPDDSLVFFDPDNSIRLVIREDTLFSVSVEDIIEIPLPGSVSRNFTVTPVPLDDYETSSYISLDDLISAEGMPSLIAHEIRAMDGSNGIFPEIPVIDYLGSFPAGRLDDIEYAYFTGGELELRVKNNLPVQLTLTVRIVNGTRKIGGAMFIFSRLDPRQTASMFIDLEGVMVTDEMSVQIYHFSTPGSGGVQVPVDLESGLEVELFARDLMADRGKARLPLTVIETGSALLAMNYEDDQDIEILALEQGWVNYSFDNYCNGLKLNLTMPNLEKDGEILWFDIATDKAGGVKRGSVDLSNAVFDYSQYHHQLLVEYSLSTGAGAGMTEFDFTAGGGGFNVNFSDFAPAYAIGYFGQSEHVFDDENFDLEVDLFKKITGDFRFTNPSLRLFYENSAGIPVSVHFNLDASSSDGTKQEKLLYPGHPGFMFSYPDDPNTKSTGDILLNRDNSNIVEFMALPPSKVTLTCSGIMNPEGRTGTPNFLTSESKFRMGMEIELPLELQLTNLGLTDTVGVDLDPDNIGMIETLILMLEVNSNFPLDAAIDLRLYDSTENVVLHSFDEIVLTEAAPVDPDGMVMPGNEVRSYTELEISGATVGHLKQATHFILAARLNTGKYNNEQIPVKLLTTSSLDFKIRVRAGLNIN